MGPIAQYLGTANANIMKSFQIKWLDEASKNTLYQEIFEKPNAQSNHKKIKAN
jgi:hypothetical protein